MRRERRVGVCRQEKRTKAGLVRRLRGRDDETTSDRSELELRGATFDATDKGSAKRSRAMARHRYATQRSLRAVEQVE